MMTSVKRLFVGVLVVWALSLTASATMIVQGYDPARHDRFANNANFVGSGYDWSGVGRTSGQWGTLISPSFVVTATHFQASGAVRFYQTNDPAGPYVERTIVQNFPLTQTGLSQSSDLTLGMLDAPATGVPFFPILDLPANSDYLNRELCVFGLSNTADPYTNVRVGRNAIDQVFPAFSDPGLGSSQNDVYIFDYDDPGGVGADEAMLQGGDSGGPSFVLADGQPALVGVHWFIFGPGDFTGYGAGSGDTFVPSFVDALNNAMASTGSTERVTTIVPEPAAVLWLVVGGLVLLGNRRSVPGSAWDRTA